MIITTENIQELLNKEDSYLDVTKKVFEQLNVKMKIVSSEYKKHFHSDKTERYVFKVKLQRNKKSFTFNFGQSYFKGGTEPNEYEIITCLEKHNVGSFDDFCHDFGYEHYEKESKRTYKAVCKNYEQMTNLFNEEELELLQYIQ